MKTASDFDRRRLIRIVHAYEQGAFVRYGISSGQLRLCKSFAEAFTDAHYLARRAHLRAKRRIDARKLPEWKNRTLDKVVRHGKRSFDDAARQILEVV